MPKTQPQTLRLEWMPFAIRKCWFLIDETGKEYRRFASPAEAMAWLKKQAWTQGRIPEGM